MSVSVEKTLVLSFGEDISSGSSGSIIAAWDDTRNIDAEGEVKSRFVPGDPAFFITQHDSTVRVTRVRATAGEISAQGQGSVSREDELGFGSADDEQSLSWIPSGQVSPAWYGRVGSGLRTDGRKISVAAGHPCLALLSYTARVNRYMLTTPVMTLAAEQEFPISVYIYYVEVD